MWAPKWSVSPIRKKVGAELTIKLQQDSDGDTETQQDAGDGGAGKDLVEQTGGPEFRSLELTQGWGWWRAYAALVLL